jgi:hypothetical protein
MGFFDCGAATALFKIELQALSTAGLRSTSAERELTDRAMIVLAEEYVLATTTDGWSEAEVAVEGLVT